MKFCVNCKHKRQDYLGQEWQEWVCAHPTLLNVNPVTGIKLAGPSCNNVKMLSCKDGQLFEKRNENSTDE